MFDTCLFDTRLSDTCLSDTLYIGRPQDWLFKGTMRRALRRSKRHKGDSFLRVFLKTLHLRRAAGRAIFEGMRNATPIKVPDQEGPDQEGPEQEGL
jgi:hypothetical protein